MNLIGHIENDWVLLYFYSTTGELVLTLTDPPHPDLAISSKRRP